MRDSRATLLDGRVLGWLEWGDPAGVPVFMFHGTPGTRRQLVLESVGGFVPGFRFINVERPGYGLSTYQPRRRLFDWPSDVAQLADELGIERFRVLGVSGGGPHAVACACLLGDRLLKTAVVSGVGLPMDGAETEAQGLRGQAGAVWLRLTCELQTFVCSHWPDRAMSILVKQLAPPDVAVMSRPEVQTLFKDDSSRPSRTTARAMIQDLKLGASDWGLDLRAIHAPVDIWHGRDDKTIPFEHAEKLNAAIPGSKLHPIERTGHLALFDHFEEVLTALRS